MVKDYWKLKNRLINFIIIQKINVEGLDMDREKLDMVMAALNRTSVRECEISTKNAHVKLVRSNAVPVAAKSVAREPVKSDGHAAKKKNTGVDINSNWVGFFYRGKKADSNPLVKLRDNVSKGQQVGSVVTMNVVHEVISETAGKLIEVLVEEGQAVEYGQPLLRILPEGE